MSLSDRWDALTDTERRWLTWVLPLLVSVVLVVGDWFWRIQEGPPTNAESRDLAVRAGVAFLLWVVVKLVFTRAWSLDGIGTVLSLLGAGGAFIRIIGRKGPQPVSDAEYVAIWATLDIGAAILIFSLLVWLLAKWFSVRRGRIPWDGSDRRVEQRRRWPDRRQG